MQSTVPLTLLDLPGNVAILSKSPADQTGGNATLATYRLVEGSQKSDMPVKAACHPAVIHRTRCGSGSICVVGSSAAAAAACIISTAALDG